MPDLAVKLASKDFRHAIALAGQATARSTIPILSMLRCRANGAFEATGTDLDVAITARVQHGGGPKVDFMLPQAAMVGSAVKVAGNDTVTLEPNGGKLAVASGQLAMDVAASLPPEDFPEDAQRMAVETFTASLSMAQLRSLARITSAISTEETRYYLNGIYLHATENGYRAAATDGHRLCWIDLALPDATGELAGIIMPRRALRLALQLAGAPSPRDAGAQLTIGRHAVPNAETSTAPERMASATRARIKVAAGSAEVTLATKLIDGTFPDYSRVIPTGADGKSFLFKSADLRRAVEAASVGSGRARAVTLNFVAEGARIAGHYVESGVNAAVTIPCEHRHAGFSVGFNGGYLLSMLDAAQGEEFVINTAGEASPALISNPADTAWGGVLMPMRV